MYTNVNLAAPIGVLLFLGTGFLLFVAGLVVTYSVIRKKVGLTRFALIGMAAIAGSIRVSCSFLYHQHKCWPWARKTLCEIVIVPVLSVTECANRKLSVNRP